MRTGLYEDYGCMREGYMRTGSYEDCGCMSKGLYEDWVV
jgi:hypothetical protein